MTTQEFKHLKLWKRPDSYMGAEWPEYYVVYGRHRDSALIDNHNFDEIKAQLEAIQEKLSCTHVNEGQDNEEPFIVNPYESHWAVGWVEWIGLHKDSPVELLHKADELLGRIENYPILNEDKFSEIEWGRAQEFWASLPISERVKLCQDHGVTIFAARHDSIPRDDNGGIYEYCRPE